MTRPLYPDDPSYATGVHRAWARLRFARLSKDPDAHASAARAALGRMLYHGGDGYPRSVPQFNSTTIEAVAWFRESGARPGFMNRRHRRHLARA